MLGLFPRATSQVAMLAWIFGDCREGCYVPVAHVFAPTEAERRPNTPLLCSAASLIPRCLQRGL